MPACELLERLVAERSQDGIKIRERDGHGGQHPEPGRERARAKRTSQGEGNGHVTEA
jgi:hypothetical protein